MASKSGIERSTSSLRSFSASGGSISILGRSRPDWSRSVSSHSPSIPGDQVNSHFTIGTPRLTSPLFTQCSSNAARTCLTVGPCGTHTHRPPTCTVACARRVVCTPRSSGLLSSPTLSAECLCSRSLRHCPAFDLTVFEPTANGPSRRRATSARLTSTYSVPASRSASASGVHPTSRARASSTSSTHSCVLRARISRISRCAAAYFSASSVRSSSSAFGSTISAYLAAVQPTTSSNLSAYDALPSPKDHVSMLPMRFREIWLSVILARRSPCCELVCGGGGGKAFASPVHAVPPWGGSRHLRG